MTRCGHGPCLPLLLRERIGDSAVPELDPMPLRLRVSGSRLHHHALLPLAGALPAAISATLQPVQDVAYNSDSAKVSNQIASHASSAAESDKIGQFLSRVLPLLQPLPLPLPLPPRRMQSDLGPIC